MTTYQVAEKACINVSRGVKGTSIPAVTGRKPSPLSRLEPDNPKTVALQNGACVTTRGVLSIVLSLWCCLHGVTEASTLTLSNFNNSPFNWTFGGFSQTSGPSALRLHSVTPGWGGAGRSIGSLDLSGFSDGRLVVDYTPDLINLADGFQVELIDGNGRSRNFGFTIPDQQLGSRVQAVSRAVIGDVSTGASGFDLSNVATWQILSNISPGRTFRAVFDNLDISTTATAPPPYNGYEASAPWRSEAINRIDQIRKADLAVRAVDASGYPLPNAEINVEMTQHEFGFGSVVRPSVINGSSTSSRQYREKVTELFNIATVGDLKWHPWEGGWGQSFSPEGSLAALRWLKDSGLETRGHVIVWPGEGNLPPDVRTMLDAVPFNAEALRTRINEHIVDIVSRTDGLIDHWDVVNETRTNNDVMRMLPEGDQAMADWFNLTRDTDPEPLRYLNEYSILASGGDVNSAAQQTLLDTVAKIRSDGGAIDGVGIQAHFGTSSLTGPTEVWAILDKFAAAELPVQITEFTYSTADEQLQAAFTRDFLTAVFAHEATTDFVMWGFWEGAIGNQLDALFRNDWTPKPNGEAFLDLVFNQWWTDESAMSDAAGSAEFRGFKGDYLVTASIAGVEGTVEATLSGDGAEVLVTVPLLVGDFDHDGTIDGGDYAIWRSNYGAIVAPWHDGDANGDGWVDAADYSVWRDRSGEINSLAAPASVPEPATACLAIISACYFAVARRRRTAVSDSFRG